MKEQILNNQDINTLSNIIAKLIARNIIELGMTINQAKDAAFNRMDKDYPEVFCVYLDQLTA